MYTSNILPLLSLSELLLDNMCCFAHEKHYLCKTSLLQLFWFVLIHGRLVSLTSATLHHSTDQMICARVIIRPYRFCLLTKRQLSRLSLDNLLASPYSPNNIDWFSGSEFKVAVTITSAVGQDSSFSFSPRILRLEQWRCPKYCGGEGDAEEIYTCNLQWWSAWYPMQLCSSSLKSFLREMLK